MKPTSAQLKQIARAHLQGHYGLPMGAMVVMGLITSAVMMPFGLMLNLNYSLHTLIIYETAAWMISLLSTVFSVGLLRIHLRLARRQTPVFSDLFYGFTRRPDRFILSGLLMNLVSLITALPGTICIYRGVFGRTFSLFVVGALLSLGGMLLAMVILLSFTQVLLLLTDHPDLGTIEAFAASARLMKGSKGRLFYIQISFAGWMLLCLLSCYIGYLWVGPYLNQTLVSFYQDVTGELIPQ